MKKQKILAALFLSLFMHQALSQSGNDTLVYLITCNPGTETYSIYGHSALRIVDKVNQTDKVYNWGVFDFSTPNFAWKFAKGRLDYMLVAETMDNFLRTYFYEERAVYSQQVNMLSSETRILLNLINENLKPENVKYRYDFFYDDCSTRIRDLLEKSIGSKLLYPPEESIDEPTFRTMTGKYQAPYPWLRFGIDLIMGSPGDKRATFRDMMFLPVDMQHCLSETVVNRDGKMIPLLQNSEVVLDFNLPELNNKKLFAPENIFSLLLVIIIILIPLIRRRSIINAIDIVIIFLFSVLAIMMIFFNFFTDHQQMKMNLNIIWLNPFLIMCLYSMIMGKPGVIWFRLVFVISVIFLITHKFLPQDFNLAVLPLALLLALRTSARSAFKWNPFTLN
ncbi:MAG TPA: DUF4105 domain-containing protein [Bacteroidales bacterium]|nr:DUF4105 domain-containing protein [Bacteroidales bacterium]